MSNNKISNFDQEFNYGVYEETSTSEQQTQSSGSEEHSNLSWASESQYQAETKSYPFEASLKPGNASLAYLAPKASPLTLEVQQNLDEVQKLYESGQYRQALDGIGQLKKLAGSNQLEVSLQLEIYFLSQGLHHQVGNYVAAIQDLNQARNIAPANAQAQDALPAYQQVLSAMAEHYSQVSRESTQASEQTLAFSQAEKLYLILGSCFNLKNPGDRLQAKIKAGDNLLKLGSKANAQQFYLSAIQDLELAPGKSVSEKVANLQQRFSLQDKAEQYIEARRSLMEIVTLLQNEKLPADEATRQYQEYLQTLQERGEVLLADLKRPLLTARDFIAQDRTYREAIELYGVFKDQQQLQSAYSEFQTQWQNKIAELEEQISRSVEDGDLLGEREVLLEALALYGYSAQLPGISAEDLKVSQANTRFETLLANIEGKLNPKLATRSKSSADRAQELYVQLYSILVYDPSKKQSTEISSWDRIQDRLQRAANLQFQGFQTQNPVLLEGAETYLQQTLSMLDAELDLSEDSVPAHLEEMLNLRSELSALLEESKTQDLGSALTLDGNTHEGILSGTKVQTINFYLKLQRANDLLSAQRSSFFPNKQAIQAARSHNQKLIDALREATASGCGDTLEQALATLEKGGNPLYIEAWQHYQNLEQSDSQFFAYFEQGFVDPQQLQDSQSSNQYHLELGQTLRHRSGSDILAGESFKKVFEADLDEQKRAVLREDLTSVETLYKSYRKFAESKVIPIIDAELATLPKQHLSYDRNQLIAGAMQRLLEDKIETLAFIRLDQEFSGYSVFEKLQDTLVDLHRQKTSLAQKAVGQDISFDPARSLAEYIQDKGLEVVAAEVELSPERLQAFLAWKLYDDMLDPTSKTLEFSDSSIRQITTEVIHTTVATAVSAGSTVWFRPWLRSLRQTNVFTRFVSSPVGAYLTSFTADATLQSLAGQSLSSLDFQSEWIRNGYNTAAFDAGLTAWQRATHGNRLGRLINLAGTLSLQTALGTTMTYVEDVRTGVSTHESFSERVGKSALRNVMGHGMSAGLRQGLGLGRLEARYETQRAIYQALLQEKGFSEIRAAQAAEVIVTNPIYLQYYQVLTSAEGGNLSTREAVQKIIGRKEEIAAEEAAVRETSHTPFRRTDKADRSETPHNTGPLRSWLRGLGLYIGLSALAPSAHAMETAPDTVSASDSQPIYKNPIVLGLVGLGLAAIGVTALRRKNNFKDLDESDAGEAPAQVNPNNPWNNSHQPVAAESTQPAKPVPSAESVAQPVVKARPVVKAIRQEETVMRMAPAAPDGSDAPNVTGVKRPIVYTKLAQALATQGTNLSPRAHIGVLGSDGQLTLKAVSLLEGKTEITIGRGTDQDISLQGDDISRQQGSLRLDDQNRIIFKQEGRNSSRVNEADVVSGSVILRPGVNVIKMGDQQIVVNVSAKEKPAPLNAEQEALAQKYKQALPRQIYLETAKEFAGAMPEIFKLIGGKSDDQFDPKSLGRKLIKDAPSMEDVNFLMDVILPMLAERKHEGLVRFAKANEDVFVELVARQREDAFAKKEDGFSLETLSELLNQDSQAAQIYLDDDYDRRVGSGAEPTKLYVDLDADGGMTTVMPERYQKLIAPEVPADPRVELLALMPQIFDRVANGSDVQFDAQSLGRKLIQKFPDLDDLSFLNQNVLPMLLDPQHENLVRFAKANEDIFVELVERHMEDSVGATSERPAPFSLETLSNLITKDIQGAENYLFDDYNRRSNSIPKPTMLWIEPKAPGVMTAAIPDRYLRLMAPGGQLDPQKVLPSLNASEKQKWNRHVIQSDGKEIYIISHKGNTPDYDHNQDRAVLVELPNGKKRLFIIDGMGGYAHGDDAAAFLERAITILAKDSNRSMTNIIHTANQMLRHIQAQGHAPKAGAVLLGIEGVPFGPSGMKFDHYVIGDAEAAQFVPRPDGTFQVIKKQSTQGMDLNHIMQKEVDEGVLDPEDTKAMREHPFASKVGQGLGGGDKVPQVRIKIKSGSISEELDIQVVGSDGLFENQASRQEVADNISKAMLQIAREHARSQNAEEPISLSQEEAAALIKSSVITAEKITKFLLHDVLVKHELQNMRPIVAIDESTQEPIKGDLEITRELYEKAYLNTYSEAYGEAFNPSQHEIPSGPWRHEGGRLTSANTNFIVDASGNTIGYIKEDNPTVGVIITGASEDKSTPPPLDDMQTAIYDPNKRQRRR